MTPKELMVEFARIINELIDLGVSRTHGSPVADYAEWLVSNVLRLTLETNSKAGYDAHDNQGIRYQIKARWEYGQTNNQTRELSVFRKNIGNPQSYDYLIGIIFDSQFEVKEAYMVPYEVCIERYRLNLHTNGNKLRLRGDWLIPYSILDRFVDGANPRQI